MQTTKKLQLAMMNEEVAQMVRQTHTHVEFLRVLGSQAW